MVRGRPDSASVGFIEWLQVVWLGLTGLAIGSFLNVVIARVPEGQSIVHPRSKCPRCGHMLPWYENIPVFSWLALRAKCSNCKAPISIQYPMVELITGILYLAAYLRFGWSWQLVGALVFFSLLIPLIVIDAQQWILPFELTLPGIGLGVVLQAPLGSSALFDGFVGALAGFLSFRAFEVLGWLAFRKEAMGAGDKFLVAMVGAFLSWRVLLAVIFLSSLQGAVFGIVRIALTGRAAPPTRPPDPIAPPPDPNAPPPDPNALPPAPALQPPAEPPLPTMSWAFLAPGLSPLKRLALLPWSLFLQPIPDEPTDEHGLEVDWTPGASNLPFGPWIGLAAIEIMLFAPWVAQNLPPNGLGWAFGL
jgi:leader peptidase (prepilin peptidase) / N-methyltransferase